MLSFLSKVLMFEQLCEKWINRKTTPHSSENIKRLRMSWKAYYPDEPLSRELPEKPFASITTLNLRECAERLMKKNLPDKRKSAGCLLALTGAVNTLQMRRYKVRTVPNVPSV